MLMYLKEIRLFKFFSKKVYFVYTFFLIFLKDLFLYVECIIINMGVNMKINVKNIDVNYIQYGRGKDLVLLHGWGQNIEMMKPLGDRLESNYRITIIDLPGFGESEEPKEVWSVEDYCSMVEELLKKIKVKNPTMIGHSFGGRVSIVYASRNEVDKVILFGSPCIRKEEKLSLKVKTLKFMKKVPLVNKLEGFAKKHIGSSDYKNASDMMRKILVETVNKDLSEYAKKITAPTLLMWGDNDNAEPIENARELEGIMKDAGLIVFPNSTHYAYLENIVQVVKIIKEFV